MYDQEAAKGLGWASIGIGAAEIAAPRQLERLLGISNGRNTGILRVLGTREIMHGLDILSHQDATAGVWSRVAGDVLDVALLSMAGRKTRNPKGFAAAFAMVLGIGVLDMLVAARLGQPRTRR